MNLARCALAGFVTEAVRSHRRCGMKTLIAAPVLRNNLAYALRIKRLIFNGFL